MPGLLAGVLVAASLGSWAQKGPMITPSVDDMPAVVAPVAPVVPVVAPPDGAKRPVIQMAILLDTSGSMGGLINQARTQLWNVVTTFATAKRDGQMPELQVAVYDYGDVNKLQKVVLPFTTDLDMVSDKLFNLSIDGGDEYCGAVIDKATRELTWVEGNEALKTIFIAGNEPFTQGTVKYQDACAAAIAKGITINTIHCGDLKTGEQTGWKDGAVLADGVYAAINQTAQIVAIAAPQDTEIAKLNLAVNTTYVPYGERGADGAANQARQEANMAGAAAAGPGAGYTAANMAARASIKGSGFYTNAGWDLVDAVKTNAVKLADVKDEDLPENMRAMTLEERQAYLVTQQQARDGMLQQINTLVAARGTFVAEETKRQAGANPANTLEQAMVNAARSQAEKRGFNFEAPKAPETTPAPATP
jgi:hypothetical protein